ncbi:MAG: hypothetical protein WC648_04985 [Candidatus Paceibacterota bacterium]|jgi:hypothetical protein
MDKDIINIKTVGRYTIDYCHVTLFESYDGLIPFVKFMLTSNVEGKNVCGIRIFLQKDGHLKKLKDFTLSKDPIKNKEYMKNIVDEFEQTAIKLNQIDDKREQDEKIMLSGIKENTL